MNAREAEHLETFRELLHAWNAAVASSMSFGLTEDEAAKAVGEWFDVSLAIQRSDRRLAAVEDRTMVEG